MDVGSKVLSKIKEVDWTKYGVVYSILFGSASRSDRYEDIDVAILFENYPDVDKLLDLVKKIADKLSISEDRIDIVVLNREDIPCILISEALSKGRIVYCRDFEKCIDDIVRRLEICWDFELAYRKLQLLETALEAVKRSWGS